MDHCGFRESKEYIWALNPKNFEFGIINQFSDSETRSETFIDMEIKLV